MAVQLEATTRRYTGLSTDTKPTVLADGSIVPAGSSFLESDTSIIWRWSGAAWNPQGSERDVLRALADINENLIALVERFDVFLDRL